MDRNRAYLGESTIGNTQTIEHPDSGGKTLSEVFAFKFDLIQEGEDELVIDVVGIEAPLANALRRIMIAEIPTMAIEDVDLYQNTSVIPDEVLAHRLGLVPVKANPDLFKFKAPEETPAADNSILFKLLVKCVKLPDGSVQGSSVYSSDLIWHPLPGQEKWQIEVVHKDILLAKLGPGQEIEADLWCEKGIGATHTKWSPVCTASYKLFPEITLTRPLNSEESKILKKKCPVGVFDIENGRAFVKNSRKCTSCRECIREEGLGVKVSKVKDHFICKE